MKMQSRFEEKQLEYLTQNFHLSFKPLPDSTYTIRSVDLLDRKKCAAYLDELTGVLQSPSRMVTASQFSKRYAFLLMTPGLYAMTMYNKGLDLSIERSLLESSVTHNQSWSSHICVTELQVTEPETQNRKEWRNELISSLFAGHLAKLWRSISETANIPMAILWENTAVRLFSLYEKRMGDGSSAEERNRIHDDFEYLIRKAPGSIFGETDNPLARFYGSTCTISPANQPVRIRKTCCLYYKVSTNESYCSACPKVLIN